MYKKNTEGGKRMTEEKQQLPLVLRQNLQNPPGCGKIDKIQNLNPSNL